jgi:hypothetical protein
MYQIKRTPLNNIGQTNEEYCSLVQEKMTLAEGGELEYLTFPILTELGLVKHMFTTRLGGVSKGMFASMNLSFTRGDERERVMENYRRIAQVMQITEDDFVCTDQTHTTNIRVVTSADAGKGVTRERDYTDIDGLITNEKGLALATFYADCVPLYFVDPVKEVIGLAHSGWKGTAARMGQCMVEKMKEVYGCKPNDIYAAIGPSICKECYEVSSDVADIFRQTFKHDETILADIIYEKKTGKYQLDLWKANYDIMLQAQIPKEQIQVTDICTCHNPDYLFSHRASKGKRGNLGAFLCLK